VEPFGTATLTEEIPTQRAVTAIVARREIMGALADPDAEPELLLQIAGTGEDAPSTIGMTWSRDELEKLLERVSGEDINLTFDGAELSQAVGDVEAHGLRERALVFAVAATGALGTGATIANAMPTTADVGGATVTSLVSPASSADSMVTDASSGGGYTAPATTGSAADSMLTDASSGGGYTAPATTGSAADSMMTDASTGGGYGPTVGTGSSGEILGIQRPSTTDDFLVGGVLLAIAGATFVGRRTGGTVRPA
jgi:hypothetical protein